MPRNTNGRNTSGTANMNEIRSAEFNVGQGHYHIPMYEIDQSRASESCIVWVCSIAMARGLVMKNERTNLELPIGTIDVELERAMIRVRLRSTIDRERFGVDV